jgi:hypothetical protein
LLEEGNAAAVSDEAARFREFCSCAFLPIDVKTVELLLCAVVGWIRGYKRISFTTTTTTTTTGCRQNIGRQKLRTRGVVAEGAGLSGVSCGGAAMLCGRRAGVPAAPGVAARPSAASWAACCEAIEGAGNTRCCPGEAAVPAGCGCAAAEGR